MLLYKLVILCFNCSIRYTYINIFILLFIRMTILYRIEHNIELVIITELYITHPNNHAIWRKITCLFLRIGTWKRAYVNKMPNVGSSFAKMCVHFWSKCAKFIACFFIYRFDICSKYRLVQPTAILSIGRSAWPVHCG